MPQVGPFTWVSAWQVRHLGGDRTTLGFLPGFLLLLLPLVVLRCLRAIPRDRSCAARRMRCGRANACGARPSLMVAIFGAAGSLSFGAAALGFHRARRRLLARGDAG